MKRALIIDIQSTPSESFPNRDRRFYFNRWLSQGTPVQIALTPYQRDDWRDLENSIGELIQRPGSSLLLEGLLHTCSQTTHTIRDPHHEGICTSFLQENASYHKQLENVQEGLRFLQKIFGVKPLGYVPPQHLFNDDTVSAVRNSGIKYLITNSLLPNFNPYHHNGLVIVPSASIKRKRINNPVVHTYIDRIMPQEELMYQIEQSAISLSQTPIKQKGFSHPLNKCILYASKQFRDARRLLSYLTNPSSISQLDSSSLFVKRQDSFRKHRDEIFS